MAGNRAVVHQKHVGDAGEPTQSVELIDADGFVRQVAAGGDDGKVQLMHQQVVQGSVRKHHAQIRIAGRDGWGNIVRLATPQQHNGRLGRAQHPLFRRTDLAVCLHRLQRGIHQRKGLLLTPFALAQSAHSRFVSRIYDQVESAQSLHCRNTSLANGSRDLPQCFIVLCKHVARVVPQLQMRPALRASVGLSMEAAVQRVFVFLTAPRTHCERLHGSVRAVVWQCLDNAVARSAVGAIGKRVAVTPVVGVKHLAKAIGAGSDVGQDERTFLACFLAVSDFKACVTGGVQHGLFQTLDEGTRRSFGLQSPDKMLEPCGVAFQFDEHTLSGVQHPAVQVELGRQTVHKRAKSHALHRPTND